MAHLINEEDAVLSTRIQAGDLDARNELVLRHQGFACFVAKRYIGHGMTFEELKSAACFGLFEAANRFIARPNCKFISYAVYWIKQAILKELNEQDAARVSISQKQAQRKVLASLSETGSVFKTATQLDRSQEYVDGVLDRRRVEFSVNRRIMAHDEEGELFPWEEIVAQVPDDNQFNMEALIQVEEMADCLGYALKYLNPREQFVLREYFGLNGDEEKTLDEIAERMVLSRERVKQIKNKALGSLRKPRILDRLVECL